MKRFISRSLIVAVLAVAGVAFLASSAQAQTRPVVSGRAFPSVQSIYQPFIPTQLQQSAFRQYNRDLRVIGRTYSRLPPWLFGYNPYPQVINYGPVYRAPVYPVPYYPYYPPYPVGGYAPGYAAGYEGGYVSPYLTPYAARVPVNPYIYP
jgi:hypothetical protein